MKETVREEGRGIERDFGIIGEKKVLECKRLSDL